jgi:hypothetical protein
MAYFSIGMALHSEGSYEDVLGLLTDGLAWTSGGAWLVERRLVAIDGTCLDVADTPANSAHFGRPGVMKGEQAAFPQASKTGADLCWRVKDNLTLPSIEDLSDGSYLAEVFHSTKDRTRRHPMTARVIEYTIEDGRHPAGPFRLITTILDPDDVSALDLAAAYSERWEIESAFDELKTHQRGPRTVLRSKSPDLVLQEIWGHLCCHYAIRSLMFDAAAAAGRDPDRVSFVAALRISRRSIPAARDVSPSGH